MKSKTKNIIRRIITFVLALALVVPNVQLGSTTKKATAASQRYTQLIYLSGYVPSQSSGYANSNSEMTVNYTEETDGTYMGAAGTYTFENRTAHFSGMYMADNRVFKYMLPEVKSKYVSLSTYTINKILIYVTQFVDVSGIRADGSKYEESFSTDAFGSINVDNGGFNLNGFNDLNFPNDMDEVTITNRVALSSIYWSGTINNTGDSIYETLSFNESQRDSNEYTITDSSGYTHTYYIGNTVTQTFKFNGPKKVSEVISSSYESYVNGDNYSCSKDYSFSSYDYNSSSTYSTYLDKYEGWNVTDDISALHTSGLKMKYDLYARLSNGKVLTVQENQFPGYYLNSASVPGVGCYMKLKDPDDGKYYIVKSYYLEGTIYYGERVIDGTFYKEWNFHKSGGVKLTEDTEKTVKKVPMGGQATFTVLTSITDSDIQEIGYEWYKVNGSETTLIEGEQSDSLTTVIDDFDTKYKCVALINYGTGDTLGETTYTFTTSEITDYNMKNIGIITGNDNAATDTSRLSVQVQPGISTTFYAYPVINENYNCEFYWSKNVSYMADDTVDVLNENLNDRTYSVVPELSDIGKTLSYFLTVKVKDSEDNVLESYAYNYKISVIAFEIEGDSEENPYVYVLSDGSATIKDASNIPSGVTSDRSWFKYDKDADVTGLTEGTDYIKVAETYKYTLYDETGVDKSALYTPAEYDYYIFVKNADSLTVNEEGKYICKNNYEYEAGESTINNYYESYIKVVGDSNLFVYAKDSNVYAEIGQSTSLEVCAKNADEITYPITYKWEKLNKETGAFEAVTDSEGNAVTTKTYTIDKVENSDYTAYRVTVSDGSKTATAVMYLRTPEPKVIYDNSTVILHKNIGEYADMTCDITFNPAANATYTWYKGYNLPKITDPDGYGYYTTIEDESKTGWMAVADEDGKTYSKEVTEADYTTYKCTVSYQETDKDAVLVTVEKKTVDFYFIIEPCYSATLEAVTPVEQIKKVGSNVTYGVRLVENTDNSVFDSVVYKWYKVDMDNLNSISDISAHLEAIDTENSPYYTIDSLTVDDYGYLLAVASVVEVDGSTHYWSQVFETNSFSDMTFEEDSEKRYALKGKSITLAPEVTHADSEGVTYQWYMDYADAGSLDGYNEKDVYFVPETAYLDADTGDMMTTGVKYAKIPGATSLQYPIQNVGENDYTKYVLVVSKNNAPCLTYTVELVEGTEDVITLSYPEGMTQSVYAVLGGEATLSINAVSSENQTLTYTWYHGENDLSTETKIAESNSNTLTLKNLVDDSFGTYTLKVADEDGNAVKTTFFLVKTSNLSVDYDALNDGDITGVQTTFGTTETIRLDVETHPDYANAVSYAWYKATEDGEWSKVMITAPENEYKTYNQEVYEDTNVLTISNVGEDDLGYYRCEIKTQVETKYAYYYVHVNTGLITKASAENAIADSTGKVEMYARGTANSGETVYYQWSKLVDESNDVDTKEEYIDNHKTEAASSTDIETYVDIAGATSDTYTIAALKKADYGKYRCKVWTRGECQYFTFKLYPSYTLKVNKLYVRPGDVVNATLETFNQATDVTYEYKWYALDTVTDTLSKISGSTTSEVLTVPEVTYSQSDFNLGYVPFKYAVKISDVTIGSEDKLDDVNAVNASLKCIPNSTINAAIPTIDHPFSARCDVQTYRVEGAEYLKIVFEADSILAEEVLHIIDAKGNYTEVKGGAASYHRIVDGVETVNDVFDGETGRNFTLDGAESHTLIIPGNTVTFLLSENKTANSYGYGIKSITAYTPSGDEAITGGDEKDGTNGKNGTSGNSGANGANGTINGASAAAKATSGSGLSSVSSEGALTISKKSIVIEPGKTKKITYTAKKNDGTSVVASAASVNESIATVKVVDATTIEITVPKKAVRGTQTKINISALLNNLEVTVKVANPTKKLKIKGKKKITVKKGKTATLNLKVTAQNKKYKTTDSIKTTFKKKGIVKVSKKTVQKKAAKIILKGKKKGKTTLTVKLGKKSVKYTIKVK